MGFFQKSWNCCIAMVMIMMKVMMNKLSPIFIVLYLYLSTVIHVINTADKDKYEKHSRENYLF